MAKRKNKKQKGSGKPNNNGQNRQQPKQANKPSKGLLSSIGGIAGGFLGGPVGAAIGSKAGDLLSTITGFGDYQVNENTLANGNSIPSFRMVSDGVEIAHREYIADVNGSTAFNLNELPINPGISTTFPWLSQIAENFENYEMLGLVFEYRPASGTAVSSASAALGVVVYATDYNVLSPNFINKQQMESYEFSCSTVPNMGMLHPVECKPASNVLETLYVRNGAIIAGADQRMYDMGSFQYATQGMQSSYLCGELWVSYHIKLKKPRLAVDGNAEWAHLTELPAASSTTANPFGTSLTGQLRSSSNLPGVVTINNNSFQIQYTGKYLIEVISSGTGMTVAPQLSFGANFTATDFILRNNVSAGAPAGVVANATLCQLITCTTNGSAAANTVTVILGAGFSAGTLDVIVIPIPYILN